jgi:hypothetical protein
MCEEFYMHDFLPGYQVLFVDEGEGKRVTDRDRAALENAGIDLNLGDAQKIIRIPVNDLDEYVLERMAVLNGSLEQLGLNVSTGPVVDFRLQEYIHDEPGPETVPLFYPAHFLGNRVMWPLVNHRKPNAIDNCSSTRKWMMPNGCYVLTRRFSSKEEKRRIVAVFYDPATVGSNLVAFENHLNVFHSNGGGLDDKIAKGQSSDWANQRISDVAPRFFALGPSSLVL